MAKAKTAEEFDLRFDQGEDIFDLADIKPEDIKRPGLESQRINIDIPAPMLQRLDHQAALRGITRQSLIKTWLYERLTRELAEGRASAFYNQLRIAWVNALRHLGNPGRRKSYRESLIQQKERVRTNLELFLNDFYWNRSSKKRRLPKIPLV